MIYFYPKINKEERVYGKFNFSTLTFSANQTIRGKDATQCNFSTIMYRKIYQITI
jgi:hypothetical protein